MTPPSSSSPLGTTGTTTTTTTNSHLWSPGPQLHAMCLTQVAVTDASGITPHTHARAHTYIHTTNPPKSHHLNLYWTWSSATGEGRVSGSSQKKEESPWSYKTYHYIDLQLHQQQQQQKMSDELKSRSRKGRGREVAELQRGSNEESWGRERQSGGDGNPGNLFRWRWERERGSETKSEGNRKTWSGGSERERLISPNAICNTKGLLPCVKLGNSTPFMVFSVTYLGRSHFLPTGAGR